MPRAPKAKKPRLRTSHHACFACRKAFHKPADLSETGWVVLGKTLYPCPDCGQPMTPMGKNFKAPKREDLEAWQVLEILANKGFLHDHNTATQYPTKLRDLEAFLEAHAPKSEGEKMLADLKKRSQT